MPPSRRFPTPPDPQHPEPLDTYATEAEAEHAAFHVHAPHALGKGYVVTVCPLNPHEPRRFWAYGVYLMRRRSERPELPY
jgi:hypothetical protein